MLLAVDVGATKTRLGLFDPRRMKPEASVEAAFPSDPSSSLDAIVKEFLERENQPVTAACFGVAGPVADGKAKITNLPWVLEESALSRTLGISKVKLLNDLEATAWAVPCLDAQDFDLLHEGYPVQGGNMAVIAPGTGLGEAYLAWDGRRHHAYASEGGHTDFAPQSVREEEMLRDFRERFGHVSYERICSGQAIPDVYGFLKDRGYAEEPPWLTARLKDAADPTPVIIHAALAEEKDSELCAMTLDLFVAVLGAEAGNLALKIMATGGVYLAGGVVFHIRQALKKGRFMEAFLHKGRMSELMGRMPVHIIINPRVALIGAACRGLQFYRE
ncbi:MAG: glucokinase [Deltaproteobacteria bacterium]|nr:glucokinase [Deltaproteobacteria bacterium]